ncbi:MAG: hypothetical protein ACJAS1_005030 [Oleiphilaceae bacterium]|jgi:hypothetical protein
MIDEFGSTYKQKSLQSDALDTTISKNIIGLISLSFELLGGFR